MNMWRERVAVVVKAEAAVLEVEAKHKARAESKWQVEEVELGQDNVIESGEVTYISQYRIHTENTPITHCTDTHMFATFESIKT